MEKEIDYSDISVKCRGRIYNYGNISQFFDIDIWDSEDEENKDNPLLVFNKHCLIIDEVIRKYSEKYHDKELTKNFDEKRKKAQEYFKNFKIDIKHPDYIDPNDPIFYEDD